MTASRRTPSPRTSRAPATPRERLPRRLPKPNRSNWPRRSLATPTWRISELGSGIRLIPRRKMDDPVSRTQAESRSRPVAVAITGGIGAGKTEALHAFARHGAATVSSDDIVHRLLREDDDVRAALLERFGTGILDDAGHIDRAAISRIVFDDQEALAWLEALLHPRVVAEYLAWREALAALPDPPAVTATEVPLLYEVGGEERFDAIVAITAPEDLRRERSQPDNLREAARRAARRARPRRRRGGVCARDRARVVGEALVPAQVPVDRPRPRAELPPRPGLARRGHLPGEQVPPQREVELRRDRADAAPPGHRRGNRHPHRREPIPRLRSLQPRDQRPLRLVVPAPPAGQVRGRANRPGRLQRRPGERR